MAIDIGAIRKAAFEAERALASFNARLMEYQDAARRRDWEHLERLHLEVMTSLESFLDGVATGQRLLEQGGRKP